MIDLTNAHSGETGDINLPKSNAYANEIRYFTNCILEGRSPDKIKAGELTAILQIMNQI